jgi:hypothetical protein
LLCGLPQDFIDWCNDGDCTPSSSKPKITITGSDYQIKKAKFEAIFFFLTMCSHCSQSDRSIPQSPFKNNVTNLTLLNGQQYPSLVMLTLVALEGLLYQRVDNSWHDDIVSVLWMMLSLNEQMSLPCMSPSTKLELFDNRIKVFLYKYKEVFGLVALANPKVCVKKITMHAPKHFEFYIKRHKSSMNTFEGTFESALKSTVKEPTKQSSRRHDHLCNKELATRQHY